MNLTDAIRAGVAGVVALVLILTGMLSATTSAVAALIAAAVTPLFPIGGIVVARLAVLATTVAIYAFAIWIVALVGGWQDGLARFANQLGRLIRDCWQGVWPAFCTAVVWLWRGFTIPVVWIVQGLWAGVVAFSATFFPWLWGGHIINSPRTAFWLAMAILVFCQMLSLVGYGIHQVVGVFSDWLGYAGSLGAPMSAPYPSFLVAAVALFALMVATGVFGRRPTVLTFSALAGVYMSIFWPLYGATIMRYIPAPVERLVVAWARTSEARLGGLANSAEAGANAEVIRAAAEVTGRLVEVTKNTACLLPDGNELDGLFADNVLKKGTRVRMLLGQGQGTPPDVYAALDDQDGVLVAARVNDDDPNWNRGVARCWVDGAHVLIDKDKEVRPVLATKGGLSSSWWPFGSRTASAAINPAASAPAASNGTVQSGGFEVRLTRRGDVWCTSQGSQRFHVTQGGATHGDRRGRPLPRGKVVPENCFTATTNDVVVVLEPPIG